MKRSAEALIIVVAALVLAAAAPVAGAVSPVVQLRGSAWLTRTSTSGDRVTSAATFHVTTAFSTDAPGAEPLTLQRAVVFFPDRAGTSGHLFPSCSAAQIERFRGNVDRCPSGSRLGGGTVTARALQLGLTATGRVAVFNGNRGRSITFNIRTFTPAYINESIDAPLTRLRGGRYGEKLTLVVPHRLQEILAGVFVGVRSFDVTIGGSVHVDGVEHSYLRARRCPRQPMHGVFDFKDWTSGQTSSATADARVRCSKRRPAAP
jgi:hypothetical protein